MVSFMEHFQWPYYSLQYVLSTFNNYRGQDVTSFLPKPDVVLMADIVYYEEVWHSLY